MKNKIIRTVLSSIMMFSMMGSIMAFAESSNAADPGVYALTVQNAYKQTVTVTPQTADQKNIQSAKVSIDDKEQQLYANAVRFQVKMTGTEESRYYLMAIKDSKDAPSQDNLKYIDQKTAGGGDLVFDLYPSDMEGGKTYYICSSDNRTGSTGMQTIATFKYYEGAAAYMVGDVNGDKTINRADGAILNRYLAHWKGYEDKIVNMKSADINQDGNVNRADAAILNRYLAAWRGYDKYFQ